MAPPRALLFDVFGTCVDWRSSVIAEGEALAGRLGLERVDWPALADAWRARYQPQLEIVRSGTRPWTKLDVPHREALEQVLAAAGACGLRTAFVPRPTEHGPGQTSDLRPDHDVELVASDFIDLARQFGVGR